MVAARGGVMVAARGGVMVARVLTAEGFDFCVSVDGLLGLTVRVVWVCLGDRSAGLTDRFFSGVAFPGLSPDSFPSRTE